MAGMFDSVNLGGLRLKNRFIFAPVKTAYGNPKGEVNQRHLTFYRHVAEGEVALIITEPTAVLKSGREHPKQLCIDEDYCVDELKKITDVIHENGSLACLNITHAGRAANPKASGSAPIAPSAVYCPATKQTPVEMTKSQIEEVIEAFGKAARRAKQAGFDAIELQAGMGYIIAQFLKDRTNKRDDEYGKDKTLFARQVFEAVFENASGLPVIVRIAGSEFVEDGITPQDNKPIIELAEKFGAAAIHVGLGSACDTPPWYYSATFTPTEKQIETFKAIKSLTSLPIIVDGRMANKEKILKAFDEGWADCIGLGKSLACDQAFVKKLKENREDEIYYCGGCLQGCLLKVKAGVGLGCIINPFVDVDRFGKSDKKLKFVVVGGGPAGMACATYAAQRGHDVVLFEKKQLGGQFNLAVKPPFKESMQRPLDSMIKELNASGVLVKMQKADYDTIAFYNPDVVVVATGAVSVLPRIEGIENENATDAFSYFERKVEIKGKRALVLGVGLIGREAMEDLLIRYNFEEVVGVDILKELPEDFTLARLKNNPKAKIITAAKLQRFDSDGAVILKDGKQENLGRFDLVITSIGTKPYNDLFEQIKDKFEHVELIGDASAVGDIYKATHDAYEVVKKY
ncbi:FAD-dependent oxidoreductase [Hippea jasoniae]|uniref:FAD-dependent oxidoreductase n=1 Tax=Hippea jasoniae TaxID=944479 RepID=UPI00068F8451|nr:FAD-dependent oxidoreductase [Hippea jasoniae]